MLISGTFWGKTGSEPGGFADTSETVDLDITVRDTTPVLLRDVLRPATSSAEIAASEGHRSYTSITG